MRLLVTGASGHLGRSLRRRLEVDESDIEPVYWGSPRASADGSQPIDLLDSPTIEREIHNLAPDAVVHLAALTGAGCDRDPALARDVNVRATEVLTTAAGSAGATRFVFASTAAVYGDTRPEPLSELDPPAPTSMYAQTKLEAEETLRTVAASTHELSVVALRIFNVYGDDFMDSLVGRLERSSAESPVTLRGFDTFVRDYVHADDVADALLAALRLPMTESFTPINIASGTATSNRELAAILSGARDIHYEVVPGTPSYSSARIEQARAILEFSPTRLEEHYPA